MTDNMRSRVVREGWECVADNVTNNARSCVVREGWECVAENVTDDVTDNARSRVVREGCDCVTDNVRGQQRLDGRARGPLFIRHACVLERERHDEPRCAC